MDFQVFWEITTILGDPLFLTSVLLTLLLLYLAMRRGYVKSKALQKHIPFLKVFLAIAIPAFLLSLIGAESLKLLFQVPRPCVPCPGVGCSIWCPFTFSFPSSHAAGSAAIATVFFLAWKKKKYLAAYAFPVIVGASRIALGVHTAYDVLGGLLLGIAVTAIVWKYGGRLYGKKGGKT
jgi:membrane-associated phospholipid phosphatase